MMQGNDASSDKILFAFLLIPVIWGAILIAPHLHGGLPLIIQNLSYAMNDPFHLQWIQNTPNTILLCLLTYVMCFGIYLSTRKNYRRNEEHGSAKWGNPKNTYKKYKSKNLNMDKILTQNVRIGMDGRQHRRNLNTMVIGGAGSGKSRFFAKPNIMQANTSFVTLDPKGEILKATGFLLKKEGYTIKVVDLINMEKSHCFNPFFYLKDDKDVLKLITNLIRNTTPKGSNTNDPFWEKSETALLQALCLYLLHEAPKEEQNFTMIMEMIGAANVKEEDEDYQSPLDQLFERLEMRDPTHLAVKQYKIYKQAAGKTAKSILISVGVRLAAFNLPTLASLTASDDLELELVGERKTAIFALIPDNDTSFNFLIGMLYTLLFQQLYYQADIVHNGRLPYHVHFLMDEFANGVTRFTLKTVAITDKGVA